VAVLAARKADPLIRSIAAEYEARTGRPATVFDESGPGAEHTGVLEILPGEAPLSR
jgi:hypothetical protein